jgi:hypothetical protein
MTDGTFAMTEAEIIPPPETTARPKDFTDDIFDTICDRMANGEGLRKICDDPEMPSRQTFLRWMEKDTGRQAKYTAAREALMDWYGEEILTIAWDSSKDTIPGEGNKPARCDNEWVQRSRLKVDTLKFLMSKLHPKRYGDKVPEQEAERDLKISWQQNQASGVTQIRRIIIDGPVVDDDGKIIDGKHALKARIRELEERLGLREGEPLPPKQLTYDPGPLPSRTEADILYSVAQAIKRNVPKADQRSPEEVISEVMEEFEKLLQAKYAPAGEAA